MKNISKKIEKEFRFIISKSASNYIIPEKIDSFMLQSCEKVMIKDVLLDSINSKDTSTGFRARSVGDIFEITSKRFLGTKKGLAVYDERNVEIPKIIFTHLNNGKLIKANKFFKEEPPSVELQMSLLIINERKICEYSNSHRSLRLMIDTLEYIGKRNRIVDYLLEIEVEHLSKDEEKFVKSIVLTFGCIPLNIGKKKRAETLLEEN